MLYNNFYIKFLYLTYIVSILLLFGHKDNSNNKIFNNYINFDYFNYQNDIITKKIIEESNWILTLEQAYLINGLIRKHRPKNCLEIGVENGGSAILILNAIKDFPESSLVSIDLYTFVNKTKKKGYNVGEKFPELMKKWKLFLGDMPHKFLSKLNIKFDLIFLDSAHVTPGEFFNFIEVLPFINDNAIPNIKRQVKKSSVDVTNTLTIEIIINRTMLKIVTFLRPYFPEICPAGTERTATTNKKIIVTQF